MGWLSDLWKHGFTAAQRARSRGVERYVQGLDAYERELAALSAAAARARAEHVLGAPRFIRVVPWESPPPPRPELAPELGAFFRRVRRVEALAGARHADAAELAPLEWDPQYLLLGPDGEHTHLAVRPGDEAVYELADDVPRDEAVEQTFATVYHWVLWLEHSEELPAEPDPPVA